MGYLLLIVIKLVSKLSNRKPKYTFYYSTVWCLSSDHITTILRQLHWLPVRQLVDCKIALLVYGLAPMYLADDCQLTTITLDAVS